MDPAASFCQVKAVASWPIVAVSSVKSRTTLPVSGAACGGVGGGGGGGGAHNTPPAARTHSAAFSEDEPLVAFVVWTEARMSQRAASFKLSDAPR